MKKRFYGFLILIFLLTAPAAAWAASPNVSVTLPDFPVQLNGTAVDNTHRAYPLLVYDGITYFPMTYHDCRYLGVETDWSEESGLVIQQSGVSAAYHDYAQNARNGRRYQATLPDFAVTVAGQRIDNANERYPLLTFRGVTYFPLTWHYAVDIFGWDYTYDDQNGLSITSSNPHPQPLALKDPFDQEWPYASLALADDTCYYRGSDGILWRHDLASGAEKAVFEFPEGVMAGHALGGINKTAQGLEITYHIGGAVMGTSYHLRLNADGSTTQLNHYAYSADLETADGIKITMFQGPAIFNNTVEVCFPGEDWRSLDLPTGSYGLFTISNGYYPSNSFHIDGHDLYLQASLDGQPNRICRIDLDTSELTVLSDREARQFVVASQMIYFSNGNDVYQLPIKGGTSVKVLTGIAPNADMILTPYEGTQLALVGEQLYIALADTAEEESVSCHLYRLDSPQPINGDSAVYSLMAQENYLVCRFQDSADTAYRAMVLDEAGRIVYKTSDAIASPSIDQGRLAYLLCENNHGYLVDLGQ